MENLYDLNAPKKATNLSVNSDLLKKSRALDINLSATLEAALVEKLARANTKKWADQNKRAVKTYNHYVAEQGYFGDDYREY